MQELRRSKRIANTKQTQAMPIIRTPPASPAKSQDSMEVALHSTRTPTSDAGLHALAVVPAASSVVSIALSSAAPTAFTVGSAISAAASVTTSAYPNFSAFNTRQPDIVTGPSAPSFASMASLLSVITSQSTSSVPTSTATSFPQQRIEPRHTTATTVPLHQQPIAPSPLISAYAHPPSHSVPTAMVTTPLDQQPVVPAFPVGAYAAYHQPCYPVATPAVTTPLHQQPVVSAIPVGAYVHQPSHSLAAATVTTSHQQPAVPALPFGAFAYHQPSHPVAMPEVTTPLHQQSVAPSIPVAAYTHQMGHTVATHALSTPLHQQPAVLSVPFGVYVHQPSHSVASPPVTTPPHQQPVVSTAPVGVYVHHLSHSVATAAVTTPLDQQPVVPTFPVGAYAHHQPCHAVATPAATTPLHQQPVVSSVPVCAYVHQPNHSLAVAAVTTSHQQSAVPTFPVSAFAYHQPGHPVATPQVTTPLPVAAYTHQTGHPVATHALPTPLHQQPTVSSLPVGVYVHQPSHSVATPPVTTALQQPVVPTIPVSAYAYYQSGHPEVTTRLHQQHIAPSIPAAARVHQPGHPIATSAVTMPFHQPAGPSIPMGAYYHQSMMTPPFQQPVTPMSQAGPAHAVTSMHDRNSLWTTGYSYTMPNATKGSDAYQATVPGTGVTFPSSALPPAWPRQYYEANYNSPASACHSGANTERNERFMMVVDRHTDLPCFDGNPEDWPAFANAFNNSKHRYDDVGNLGRLQKALKGVAKQRVKCLLIYPAHVPVAMASLEAEFGRPDLLVNHQISAVRALRPITETRIEEIISFSCTVQNCCAFLDTPATSQYLQDLTLLEELVSKLPMSRRLDWTAVAHRIGPSVNLKDFGNWIAELAKLVGLAVPKTIRQNRSNHVLLSTEVVKNEIFHCYHCLGAHEIENCVELLRLKPTDRINEIRKKRLCFNCLHDDHVVPNCDQTGHCGVDNCIERHHPILHVPKADRQTREEKNERSRIRKERANPKRQNDNVRSEQSIGGRPKRDTTDQTTVLINCREQWTPGAVYYHIVPVTLYGPRRKVQTYALLDDAAAVTMIDSSIAALLELDGPESTMSVKWYKDSKETVETTKRVVMGISGTNFDSKRFDIENVRTVDELRLPVQSVERKRITDNNEHLHDIPFLPYSDARPTILIGLEHHHLGVPKRICASETGHGLTAAETSLGWVIYGCDGKPNPPAATVLLIHDNIAEPNKSLSDIVKNHFTTEEFGVKVPTNPIESDDDRRSRTILETTTKRIGDRFETGLLWRCDNPKLPDSYGMALHRLKHVEKKMMRMPEYAHRYQAQISAYLEKGYARKLTASEAKNRTNKTWFLPHFAVENPHKPGKFRLVFDAAAKVGNTSLNSCLLSGPDANASLARILLLFRTGPIAVCADIREMYHQVRIRNEDQDAQRFLWRNGDQTKEPEQFVMTAMTFGSTCSPAAAHFVKNQNAKAFEEEMPEAADVIRRLHYVDDFVASFPTPQDAVRISQDVVHIHRQAGFDLRGFTSNDEFVRVQLGGSNPDTAIDLEPTKPTERVLGMVWNTEDDSFRFQTQFVRVDASVISGDKTPTKRQILSVAMSIFDPFGILADFVLVSKLIIQDLWRTDTSWDETVPNSIASRWERWRSQIERTKQVRVPRCFLPQIQTAENVQLHVFADASESAFAAVAYWRIQYGDHVRVMFVMGKARCAPIKPLTIPRLELQAALLASRIVTEIRENFEKLPIAETVIWSDSATVLKWLRSVERKYKAFVAFRVIEALENAGNASWRWVPSAQNPADDATRVTDIVTFEPDRRWIRGPEWLLNDAANWPKETDMKPQSCDQEDAGDVELRKSFVGVISFANELDIDFERFSNFDRLCRAVAWMYRFINNVRTPTGRLSTELQQDEVQAAIHVLCRLVQRKAYSREVDDLKSNRLISSKSPIHILRPYMDDNGLMRIHGRTDLAAEGLVEAESRRPILLPKNHRFTMLLIRKHHVAHAHQLTDATIASVRTKYWIPAIRSLVRSVKNSCNSCRIRSTIPVKPPHGQLPSARMAAYERPFTHTGLDFFGPVNVTIGRRHEKRWIAIFTCLTIRAVHLEIAADLSTDACLTCIRNLCNVRGVPTTIRCDNGTNFVGA